MSDPEPPAWDTSDSFERYFADTGRNGRACAGNFPDVFALLKRVHRALEKAEQVMGGDSGTHRAVARMLLVRAHSAYLAGCRLGMGAQPVEASAVSRVALELTWYALHIALDPAPPARLRTWLERGDSPEADQACKNEFTVKRVRASHAAIDPEGAEQLRSIYEALIDLGAHPNQLGLMASVKAIAEEDPKKRTYNVGILHDDPVAILLSLKLASSIAVGTLKAAQLLYPERFRLSALDQEIAALIDGLNAVFKGRR